MQVEPVIANELRKDSISHLNASFFPELMADNIMDAVQFGYDATTEGIKIPVSSLTERVTIEIIQQQKGTSL